MAFVQRLECIAGVFGIEIGSATQRGDAAQGSLFVRDSLDRRYKSSQELTDELSLPILGYVPERLLGRSTINGKRRRSLSQADFDAFRILRTNIEFLRPDEPPQLILVTSALPEEGKSTVSTALAVAYALIGKRTLLVESDMRRPTLAQRVGVSPQPGLTDYQVRLPGEAIAVCNPVRAAGKCGGLPIE